MPVLIDEIVETETLSALILPWAKERHPEKYEKTLAVVGREETFRAYLVRLVEVRWNEEKAWRGTVPLSVLELTSLQVTMLHRPSGTKVVCGGRQAKDRLFSFYDLTMDKAAFEQLLEAIEVFDLERVE